MTFGDPIGADAFKIGITVVSNVDGAVVDASVAAVVFPVANLRCAFVDGRVVVVAVGAFTFGADTVAVAVVVDTEGFGRAAADFIAGSGDDISTAPAIDLAIVILFTAFGADTLVFAASDGDAKTRRTLVVLIAKTPEFYRSWFRLFIAVGFGAWWGIGCPIVRGRGIVSTAVVVTRRRCDERKGQKPPIRMSHCECSRQKMRMASVFYPIQHRLVLGGSPEDEAFFLLNARPTFFTKHPRKKAFYGVSLQTIERIRWTTPTNGRAPFEVLTV